MRGQWWIILAIIIVTCNGDDVRCPEQYCTCYPNHNSGTELRCPTGNNSIFVVNVAPAKYIQIQCENNAEWSDFRVSNLFPARKVESILFQLCKMPTDGGLAKIARKLGAESVDRLIFQSYGNEATNLTKKDLEGFPKLQQLILSSNNVSNLSNDLFTSMPELTWLDLRENNVRLRLDTFQNSNNLTVLELGQNGITSIEPGVFDKLTKLSLLNLWQNRLTKIEPGTFDKLASLKSLDINSNELTTLSENVFQNLSNLEVLNLFGNNFTSLPGNIFQHNKKLIKVFMYTNKRNMTTLPSGLFANLTKLTLVELRSNGLITLPEDLFRGSISINNINLERNYLASLPRDIFKGLHNLTVLKLHFNELASLPDGIFSDTLSLTEIDLSKNHITSISRHLFEDLVSLNLLDMSENQLQTIEDASFKSLENLKIAKFSNNLLTFNNSLSAYHDEFGKKSPFHHCLSLEELYLDKNNISEIFGDWIIISLKLKILDLKYNQIPYISTQDLQFTSNEIRVDLRHNNIIHINLRSAEIVAKSQTNKRSVVILVEDNPIACDCNLFDFLRYLEGNMHPYVQNYFHIIPGNLKCQSPEGSMNISVSDLKSESLKCIVTSPCPKGCTCWQKPFKPFMATFLIDCSYRNLTSIPRNIQCLPLHKLELNLEGNKLTQLVPLTDLGLSNISMSKLLLSDTNISSVPLDVLPSDVEVLELHNNNINKLDSDVLQFMSNSTKLSRITLHKNPWTCDCDTRDLLNFIQTEIPRISVSSLITCKDTTISMLKMTATDFCPPATAMIVGISLTVAVVGLLIGILAALYYRYQQEIKVWLYAHQLCLWFVTEDELDKDKLYDAFISYSHKDEEFVINELVSKLESGPRPFKLCIHFRDWLAGEWIPNQIAHSVDDSKRTIVVLSPNFLESVWGRMEFRAAHKQALSEGRARVILVLYGEIGAIDNLDPELKAYLSMNTYVKWGDPWFWDKLRYALPHPPELTRSAIRNKIFEKHQPTIQINGDKKELIYPNSEQVTASAASTPPADTIKVFKCDNINEAQKHTVEKLNISNSNGTVILSPEQLILNNSINKVHCTTV
ncbi:toll like receptor [Halictus rubicundus]|uniref:toll like receptor n=1 Tax=Halictus rubicundus TaxID=77578 RepID=UPI0040369FDB